MKCASAPTNINKKMWPPFFLHHNPILYFSVNFIMLAMVAIFLSVRHGPELKQFGICKELVCSIPNKSCKTKSSTKKRTHYTFLEQKFIAKMRSFVDIVL